MSVIEVASEIHRPWRIIKPKDLTLDADLCAKMAAEYRMLCVKRPFVNRCLGAFMVCAWSFPDLDLKAHPQKVRIVELRQQLMAFCRTVSAGEQQVNSWMGIARVFDCHHGTVINAHRIYGDAMEKMLHE
jgi:hypothetical protein